MSPNRRKAQEVPTDEKQNKSQQACSKQSLADLLKTALYRFARNDPSQICSNVQEVPTDVKTQDVPTDVGR